LAAANTEFHPQAEAGTGTGGWVLELSDGGEQAPVRVLLSVLRVTVTTESYLSVTVQTCKYPQVNPSKIEGKAFHGGANQQWAILPVSAPAFPTGLSAVLDSSGNTANFDMECRSGCELLQC